MNARASSRRSASAEAGKVSGSSLSRRDAVKVGVAGIAGAAIAGRTARAQDGGWQGEITFYAQAYTPNSQIPDANQLTAFQDVADAYMADHPGITITFVDEQFDDYMQTVRVKGAGQELWDVFWLQFTSANGTLPRGIVRDLTADFDAPNPYIQGNAAWRDVMNPEVVAFTVSPAGAIYVINGDWVGTAFFYNKGLFEQAGITEVPTTWSGIKDACQKLNDAGVKSMAGSWDPSWFGRHFLSEFYSPDYETITGCDGSVGRSPQDEAAAIKSGLLSPKDPRFMAWWEVFKGLTDLWDQEYLAQELTVAADAAQDDFAAGQSGMYYSGSWIPRNMQTLGIDFELGSFSFPVLTKEDSEYATGVDVSGVVGGPHAAYQYAMSTRDSNQTLEEEGKEAAVLDFLQYIGTPEVVEKVVNELGSFAPTFAGTTAVPGLETFSEQAKVGLKVVSIGDSSAKLMPAFQKTFSMYLAGDLDLQQAGEQMQTELDRAVEDYQRNNPDIDIDSCYAS